MKLRKLLDRLPPPLRQRRVLLSLVALLVLLGYFGLRETGGGALPATAFYPVKRGDFVVSIVEGGTLQAVHEVVVRNEVEGTARIIYIVPEGSYVKQGDLLVELDSSQAQDQVNQQEINVQKAQAAFIQAESELEIQRSLTNSEIDAAALKLRFAELDLRKFDQGQSKVDFLEASNKLVQAQSQLAVSLDNFQWTTNLAAKGYETRQKVQVDRLSVMNNRNSLIVASNSLWMLLEFDLPKQREQFLSEVRQASNELQRVIAQARIKISRYEADLLTQSNTLVLNRKKLERDQKNLAATKIHAPQDGLVVYPAAGRWSSESLIEEGAMVRNRQELIKLPDTSQMKVAIKVHESHVNMVTRGLPAYVTLDSLPDQRFRGVVDYVAVVPDTQMRFGNPNLKVYRTEVLITDPLPDVKPGVSAKAEIIITNIANALSVPIQAVTTRAGRQVCYVKKGRGVRPVPVQVGMFNTKFIEILDGLKEGDEVLLAPPYDTQARDLEGGMLKPGDARAATNAPPAASSPPPAAARPPAAPGAGNRAAMLKRFDKNGDGKLDDAERAALRAAMQKRFGGAPAGRGGHQPPRPGGRPGAPGRPGAEPR